MLWPPAFVLEASMLDSGLMEYVLGWGVWGVCSQASKGIGAEPVEVLNEEMCCLRLLV